MGKTNTKVNSLKESKKEVLKDNRLISKSQQRFRSGGNDKRMQPINSINTFAYGTRKNMICETEENKQRNIIKQHKNDYQW